MTEFEVVTFAAFRTHILLPGDTVGAIVNGLPTFPGLDLRTEPLDRKRRRRQTFYRNGRPVLEVDTRVGDQVTWVRARALADLWVQEPGLTVVIRGSGGTWRGYARHGRRFHWTSPVYAMTGSSAYRSTVHFARTRADPKTFTEGVEYRSRSGRRIQLSSSGGFTELLDRPPAGLPPIKGVEVEERGHLLRGYCTDKSGRPRRRWELAAHPQVDEVWMHFLGWTGGAGGVVDEHGRTPPPGWTGPVTEYAYLWDPPGWRELKPGQSISQWCSLHELARAA